MKEQNLCNNIGELRRAAGMTQEQLAQRLGLSYQAVSKWENGLSCPDVFLLPDIAEIFGVSLDRLFGVETAASENVPAPLPPVQPCALPWPDDGNYYAVLYRGHKLFGGPVVRQGKQNRLTIEGSLEGNLSSCFTVECQENVSGDVLAAGDVTCDAVGGDVSAAGDVTCDAVGGNVNASGDVNCDDVHGTVKAGGDVNCDNVDGSVTAGGDLNCDSVAGNATAGCDLHVEGGIGGFTVAGGDAETGDAIVFTDEDDGRAHARKGKKSFSFRVDGKDKEEILAQLREMKAGLGDMLNGIFGKDDSEE